MLCPIWRNIKGRGPLLIIILANTLDGNLISPTKERPELGVDSSLVCRLQRNPETRLSMRLQGTWTEVVTSWSAGNPTLPLGQAARGKPLDTLVSNVGTLAPMIRLGINKPAASRDRVPSFGTSLTILTKPSFLLFGRSRLNSFPTAAAKEKEKKLPRTTLWQTRNFRNLWSKVWNHTQVLLRLKLRNLAFPA